MHVPLNCLKTFLFVRSRAPLCTLLLSSSIRPSIATSILGSRPFGLPSFPGLPVVFTHVPLVLHLFSDPSFCRLHSSSPSSFHGNGITHQGIYQYPDTRVLSLDLRPSNPPPPPLFPLPYHRSLFLVNKPN